MLFFYNAYFYSHLNWECASAAVSASGLKVSSLRMSHSSFRMCLSQSHPLKCVSRSLILQNVSFMVSSLLMCGSQCHPEKKLVSQSLPVDAWHTVSSFRMRVLQSHPLECVFHTWKNSQSHSLACVSHPLESVSHSLIFQNVCLTVSSFRIFSYKSHP